MTHVEDPLEHTMGLMDHLRELRKRLIYSFIAITIGAIASYVYAGELFNILCAPYFVAFPNSLYAHERKLVIPFIVFSTLLFVGGSVFCYQMVLPLTFSFFHQEFKSIGVTPTIRVGDHISMTITALAGFGAVFELPLLTFFLARAGVIDHRTLIDWFKHAVVVIFVVAAVLTPPDVLTQFLMAGPLLVLYVFSIGIAYLASSPTSEVAAAIEPTLPATTPH